MPAGACPGAHAAVSDIPWIIGRQFVPARRPVRKLSSLMATPPIGISARGVKDMPVMLGAWFGPTPVTTKGTAGQIVASPAELLCANLRRSPGQPTPPAALGKYLPSSHSLGALSGNGTGAAISRLAATSRATSTRNVSPRNVPSGASRALDT